MRAAANLVRRAQFILLANLLAIGLTAECEAQWILFGRAQRRYNECVDLFESRRLEEASSCIQRFLSDYPHSRWSEHLQFLDAKLETDIQEATEKLYRFTADFPDGPYSDEAYFCLGQTLELNHEIEGAQRCYLVVYERFPESERKEEAALRAARCMLVNEEPEAAEKHLVGFLASGPAEPWRTRARELYADALYQQGAYADAQYEYRRVISSFDTPENAPPRCYVRIADVYEKIGDYESAVQTYRHFLTLFPENPYGLNVERELARLASKLDLDLTEPKKAYIVDAGAFDSKPEAMSLVARLRNIGYQAYVVARTLDDGKVLSVRLGPYESRVSAMAAVERLREEAGIDSTLVTIGNHSGRGIEGE